MGCSGLHRKHNSLWYNDGYKYVQFRDEVFMRDNNKCILCKSEVQLELHHIISRSERIDLAYTKSNACTLCNDCHTKLNKYLQKGQLYSKNGRLITNSTLKSIMSEEGL
jgi:5-methylcytosine-specific restriction endonuclease McrA